MINTVQRAERLLESCKTDAVLLFAPYNIMYITGMENAEGAVFLLKNNIFFITDGRYIEAASKLCPDVQVLELNAQKGISSYISELKKRFNIKKIAVEEDYITLKSYTALKTAIDAELVPAAESIRKIRALKDEAEISAILTAQRIAEKALKEILPQIKEGMTERELYGKIITALYSNGAHGLSFDPIVLSGANTAKPHGTASDKEICMGEFITMDFGCIYNGYCSDMTRTVALGHADDFMKKIYDIVLEAQERGIKAAVCGAKACEPDLAGRAVIENAGYGRYFVHSFGHGVGTEIHELPTVSSRSDTVLQNGMVVTAEPGIYIPGKFGVRIEDMLIIRDNECQNITGAEKNLIILN